MSKQFQVTLFVPLYVDVMVNTESYEEAYVEAQRLKAEHASKTNAELFSVVTEVGEVDISDVFEVT